MNKERANLGGGSRREDSQKRGRAGAATAGMSLFSNGFWLRGFLVFFVVALCAVFAVRVGALEKNLKFQEQPAFVSGDCGAALASGIAPAFSESNRIALPLCRGEGGKSSASFAGRGMATGARIGTAPEGEVEIRSLYINNKKLCGPCKNDVEYGFSEPEYGELRLTALAGGVAGVNGSELEKARIVFIENSRGTAITPMSDIEISGGWESTPNSEIPSSVYGVDAPFHINRARVLPEYLARMQWPYAAYTFVSAIPPSLLVIAGDSPQYAYKLWEIALFLFPVAIFYLLSRKLAVGKDAIFALGSTMYICFPITGILTGGGPDLFIYGMTAHTLATGLSLLFFLFAFEYANCGGRKPLALAALFFLLAFLSNQRIVLALCILGFAASVPAALQAKYRRVALLLAALFFATAWSTAPFVETFLSPAINGGNYGTLGNARIEGEWMWAPAFMQSGCLVLPVLFAAGIYWAWKNRELMPLLLAFGAFLVLVVATSAGVNRIVPFIDGIRFLPSFFLPAFFIAGIGAYAILKWLVGGYSRLCDEKGWDRTTAGGAILFAVLLPCAIVFFVVAGTTADFYRESIDSVFVAQDYVSQQGISSAISGERALFISESWRSQYPVYEKDLQRLYIEDLPSPGELADKMHRMRLRYVVLGSTKHSPIDDGEKTRARYDEYLALAQDDRFVEIPANGSNRLFMLKDGEVGAEFFSEGAKITGYEVMPDRAKFTGRCETDGEGCGIVFFAYVPKENSCVVSGGKCVAEIDSETRAVSVRGIPRGGFEISVEPKNPDYLLPIALASALAFGACVFLSRES